MVLCHSFAVAGRSFTYFPTFFPTFFLLGGSRSCRFWGGLSGGALRMAGFEPACLSTYSPKLYMATFSSHSHDFGRMFLRSVVCSFRVHPVLLFLLCTLVSTLSGRVLGGRGGLASLVSYVTQDGSYVPFVFFLYSMSSLRCLPPLSCSSSYSLHLSVVRFLSVYMSRYLVPSYYTSASTRFRAYVSATLLSLFFYWCVGYTLYHLAYHLIYLVLYVCLSYSLFFLLFHTSSILASNLYISLCVSGLLRFYPLYLLVRFGASSLLSSLLHHKDPFFFPFSGAIFASIFPSSLYMPS